MKFLLKTVILAAIIIKKTSTSETLTDETTISEITTTDQPVLVQSIILIPNRNTVIKYILCPEGQRKDNHGKCLQIV